MSKLIDSVKHLWNERRRQQIFVRNDRRKKLGLSAKEVDKRLTDALDRLSQAVNNKPEELKAAMLDSIPQIMIFKVFGSMCRYRNDVSAIRMCRNSKHKDKVAICEESKCPLMIEALEAPG